MLKDKNLREYGNVAVQKEFEEQAIQIKRVSKKGRGGNKSSFSALVIIGDKKGRIGYGLGKALDVSSAVQKAVAQAKRGVITVSIREGTIPHEVAAKYGAAEILLKPAPKGSGIIAGGSLRSVLQLVGIKDISAKILGTSNKATNIACAVKALRMLR